jgi:heme-degrading monooxygenase HmoA
MATFANIDPSTSFLSQLDTAEVGPITLMDALVVPTGKHDEVLAMWEKDSHLMKAQPGLISVQLHRGVGSNFILNIAVWESSAALKKAYLNPEFQKTLDLYPKGTIVYQHIVQKIAVPNICIA